MGNLLTQGGKEDQGAGEGASGESLCSTILLYDKEQQEEEGV